jgi:plasmid replication initiation protein
VVKIPGSVPGSDERNLARLGLILAPRRLAGPLSSWERNVAVDSSGTIQVKCTTEAGSVVPHGMDNDIMVGLINGFVAAGAPAHGRVVLTVSELLKLSGLGIGGKQYAEIQNIFDRLQKTFFEIIECWYDGRKHHYTSTRFNLVTVFAKQISANNDNTGSQFSATTKLVVEISSQIVESIRTGYVRALDMEFYASLSQPLVRTLYRQLEERRIPFNAPASSTFNVNLYSWGAQLGLHCEDTSEIRRSLVRAHTELVKLQYLQSADIEGRGKQQEIHYHFSGSDPVPAQKHVLLLTERGINAGRANELARKHTGERIEAAAARFDELHAEGQNIRNPGGYLSKILEAPENYLPGTVSIKAAVPKSALITVDMPPLAAYAPAKALEAPEVDEDGNGSARGVLKALVAQGKLTTGEMQACLGLLEQRRVSAAEITMLGVPKKKVTPSEQVARWMLRPTPLL